MSVQRRKITYYSIEFVQGDRRFFDEKLFSEFLNYVKLTPHVERIFNDTSNKKAIDLACIFEETKEGIHMFKLTFKSCKYNHSPDYMSSVDGSERASDKKLEEGEKELTHACMRMNMNEAYTIFEQRRNGVSIGGVIKYFNKLLKKFLLEKGVNDNFYLFASLIPADDFLSSLNNVERIIEATLYTEKKVLGSGFLNLMPIDASAQDDLAICIKAKKRESLTKSAMKAAFLKLGTEGTITNRIRIHAKDIDKLDVVIDSVGEKKVDEITVELNGNGTVNSHSIFAKIEELMGVTE